MRVFIKVLSMLIVLFLCVGLKAEVKLVEVQITTEPSEADIYINSEKKIKTPGSVFLAPGSYSIKIAKKGYLSANETLEVTDTNIMTKAYTLKENCGYLELYVVPSTAEIKLNEEVYKKAPLINLKPGHYKLELQLNGYLSTVDEFDIVLGEKLSKSYHMEENQGTLDLTVIPAEAKVLINKEDYTGQKQISLKPGEYMIELSKEGYTSITDAFAMVQGQKMIKNYTLEAKTGKMQFSVTPSNTDVIMRKDKTVFKSWNGMSFVKDIPFGTYELEMKVSGYKTKKVIVEIKDNKVINKNITMKVGEDGPDNMILVEGGTFIMGKINYRWHEDEPSAHEVTVSSFFMDKYELTVGEYKSFITASNYLTEAEHSKNTTVWDGTWTHKSDASWKNPYYEINDKFPVTCVNWFDVIEYCNWRSTDEELTPCYTKSGNNVICDFTKDGYRLPTEAEWEFAAKGGLKSQKYYYSGSNECLDVGWFENNAENHAHETGLKRANELGIYDMSGNVREWCWDWKGYYPGTKTVNPKGPETGEERVIRGGDWHDTEIGCVVTDRCSWDPCAKSSTAGFRLVRTLK